VQWHPAMKTLRPIPTAHRAIVIAGLILISTILMWSYLTDLQQPPAWLTFPIIMLVMAGSVISRRQGSQTQSRQ